MIIEPCRTCHFSPACSIRLDKLRAVRGLKLTKIQFRCDLLRDSLKPGVRVQADLAFVATGYSYFEHELKTEKKTVDAVFMGWSGKKARIYVPYRDADGWWLQSLRDPDKKIHVLRVEPRQLHSYGDLHMVSVCVKCGFPLDEDSADWGCGEDGCQSFTDSTERPVSPEAQSERGGDTKEGEV